jgi:Flp pilus assembly protein TadD
VTAPAPLAQPIGRPETLDVVDMRARARDATARNALADAEVLLERATAAAPTDAESWNDLGVVRVRRGQLAKGLEAFERALALQPANADVRRNLAVALDRDGQRAAAATHYRAFLALAPQHPDRAAVERRLAAH